MTTRTSSPSATPPTSPLPPVLRIIDGAAAALPDDIRVSILVQPRAPLGHLVVTVGLGRGSIGRGHRVGDDAALHVAIVRRLACHLAQYARDFEHEAAAEEPNWAARLASAAALLDPLPAPQSAPRPSPLRPCDLCGALSPWAVCASCAPF